MVSHNSRFLDIQNIRFDTDFLLYVAVLLRSDITMYQIVSRKRDGDREAVLTPLDLLVNVIGVDRVMHCMLIVVTNQIDQK
jgi:hypothetical protein